MENKVGSLNELLITTSFLEGSTGLTLMAAPSFVINLLLGSPLTEPISLIITRVSGSALISIAITCWLLRKSEGINTLMIAILFYNLASIVLFVYAGWYQDMNGIALWPAVAIHFAMALWIAKCLSFTGKFQSIK